MGAQARSYVVVGGGIVGTACALRLRAAGFEVTLIDEGDPRRGASFGNIGHIAAEQVEPLASPHTLATFLPRLFTFGGPVAFRARDIGTWLPWSIEFMRASNTFQFAQGALALDALQRESMAAWERMFALAQSRPHIRPCGHWVVWMTRSGMRRGLDAWRRAATGTTSFREMDSMQLGTLENCMRRRPAGGLAFSGTGQVSEPQAVRDALTAAFEAQGGIVVHGNVTSVAATATEATALTDAGTAINADAMLITAGAWSAPLMAQLGVRAPLIGERGYSMQSEDHSWPGGVPPVVFEERAVVVSRFTSGLRASSFVEFGNPNNEPDPRKWDRIAHHLRELGIAFSDTPDKWSGPRPTLPDYLPAIGRLEVHPRVLYAFGHQHLGMTLASVTAELIESLALWSSPRIDLTPFRVERFA